MKGTIKKIGGILLGGVLPAALLTTAALADASEISTQVLSSLNRDLGVGGSLTSRASFGLFETGEDYLYRVDTLAFTRSLRPTRRLSKPGDDDGFRHGLYSRLSNMKQDDTFEYGGSHETKKGVFVGSLGYAKSTAETTIDQDQNGSAIWDSASRGTGDTTQLYLSYGGRLGDERGWGVALNYLDSDGNDRQSSTTPSGTNISRSTDRVRGWKLIGAYADNSSDSFGWSVGGWLGDRSSERMLFASGSLYDTESSEGYDISGDTYGIAGRATWYNEGSDHEIALVYGRGGGNVDNPIVDSNRFGTSLTQRRLTSNDIDTDVTALVYRAVKRLGDKIDLAYGVGYSMTEITVRTMAITESGSVGNLSPSYYNNEVVTVSRDALTIPFAVRLWITSNLTLTIGAQFSKTENASDFYYEDFLTAPSGTPNFSETFKVSGKGSSTAAAIVAEYFFSDHLQLQLALLEQQDDTAAADAFGTDEISFSANFVF